MKLLHRPVSATVVLAASLLAAGEGQGAQESLRFARLTVEDGLSQSSVMHIVEDRLGFLWFATQEGLNRYDGYRFVVHRARDQPGFLRSNEITAFAQDRRGDLWIGTSRGLHRLELDTGRIDREGKGAGERAVPQLVEDAAGRIWFAAAGDGLWMLEPGAGSGSSGGRVSNDAFPAGADVTALARADGSAICAAWSDGRLLRIEREGGETRAAELLRDLGGVSALARDANDGIWIGRRDGELLRYGLESRRVDRFPQAPRRVLRLLPAQAGGLWIGARAGGLVRLFPETGAVVSYRHDPDDPASLLKDDVASLHEDRFGSLWIGTWNGGVNRLDPHAQEFRTFKRRPRVPGSLPDDDVTAMAEAPDGRIWLGSRNGVLAVGDARSGRFAEAAARARGAVSALAAAPDAVFVGTGLGLAELDPRSGRELPLREPLRAAQLAERPITTAATGAGGELWIASRRELFRVAPLAARVARFEPPLLAPASALHVTPARVWVGSQQGEVVVGEPSGDGVAFRRIEARAGEAGAGPPGGIGFVASLHEDAAGMLWMGTRRGLVKLDPTTGAVAWLAERSGLPSTDISGLLAGEDGLLWAATNRGLTRLDPRTGALAHFGSPEGAQGTGYAERAFARGASGLLYFAGTGVTAFDPREVRLDPHPPGIVFTGLEILHRPVEPRWREPASPIEGAVHATRAVTLGPGDSVVSVEMAALHYADPKSIRFAYRLEGFDPDWIETDAQNRVATYTRLAPGDYLLRARARTKNGVLSEREATLAIHVLPPWWRTRAAVLGWIALGLLASALTWSEVRRRTRVRIALLERDTLRRESLTDPLTGLYNRRFLTSYLQHELPRSLREYESKGAAAADAGADLLFLLVDADHFKSINDEYSHAVGDRVLVEIARVLREQIRDSDLAIRLGGDEFLVVSRSLQRRHAGVAAERIRAAVEAVGVGLAAQGGPASTVSIGYAAFPFLAHDPAALTWEQTLELADRALHLTKARRRNAHTGLLAGPDVAAAVLTEFLRGGREAALPEGVRVATD